MLAILEHEYGETEIVLSSITVIEPEHGLNSYLPGLPSGRQTARVPGRRLRRDPVEPFIREMPQLAAKIDAGSRQPGCAIPFTDLLIGATTLHSDTPSALGTCATSRWSPT